MNLIDEAERQQALTVPCPFCHAETGEPCVRKGSDEVLANVAAHPTRITAAGIVRAPLDSRELR